MKTYRCYLISDTKKNLEIEAQDEYEAANIFIKNLYKKREILVSDSQLFTVIVNCPIEGDTYVTIKARQEMYFTSDI